MGVPAGDAGSGNARAWRLLNFLYPENPYRGTRRKVSRWADVKPIDVGLLLSNPIRSIKREEVMRTLKLPIAGSLLVLCCAMSGAYAADSDNAAMSSPMGTNSADTMQPAGAPMSDSTYHQRKAQISDEYKVARKQCDSLASNAKDLCVAEAKSNERKGMARLEADRKPSAKANEKRAIENAEANYDVAKVRCDAKTGNEKDVCMKAAKAAEVSAKADAKTARTTADARADASSEKHEADYKLALQKCDGLAGTAKDNCVADAKTSYGK